jgi:hypothetical protein
MSDASAVATPVAAPASAGAAGVDAKAPVAPADPDFEFEVESKNDKGEVVKAPTKIKSSEAKAKLARLEILEREHTSGRAEVNKYYKEQILPLQQEIDALRKNPQKLYEFAKRLGVDFDTAALEYAKQQVELGKLTPEQREAKELREKLQKYEMTEKQQAEQKQQEEARTQVMKQSEKLQGSIIAEATKVGLPKDPAVMMIMTGYMRNMVDQNLEPNAAEAAQYAMKVFQGGLRQSMSGLTYEQIEKEYPELLTKVREGDIKKVRGSSPSPTRTRPKPDPTKPKQFLTQSEYQEKLERGE